MKIASILRELLIASSVVKSFYALQIFARGFLSQRKLAEISFHGHRRFATDCRPLEPIRGFPTLSFNSLHSLFLPPNKRRQLLDRFAQVAAAQLDFSIFILLFKLLQFPAHFSLRSFYVQGFPVCERHFRFKVDYAFSEVLDDDDSSNMHTAYTPYLMPLSLLSN